MTGRLGRAAGVGLALGLLWGIVARGFMRLLTTSPEFTWSGTLSIVGVAGLVGLLVAVVRAQRLAGRSRWWRVLGLPFVLLFGAAGVVMLPGVVGVVMLADRRRWMALPGVALVAVTFWAALQDVGWPPTPRQGAGLVVLLGCLVVEGLAARELVRRWRPRAVVAAGPAPAGSGSLPVSGEARHGTSPAP